MLPRIKLLKINDKKTEFNYCFSSSNQQRNNNIMNRITVTAADRNNNNNNNNNAQLLAPLITSVPLGRQVFDEIAYLTNTACSYIDGKDIDSIIVPDYNGNNVRDNIQSRLQNATCNLRKAFFMLPSMNQHRSRFSFIGEHPSSQIISNNTTTTTTINNNVIDNNSNNNSNINDYTLFNKSQSNKSNNIIELVEEMYYDEGIRNYNDMIRISFTTLHHNVQQPESRQIAAIILYNLGQICIIQSYYNEAIQYFLYAYELCHNSSNQDIVQQRHSQQQQQQSMFQRRKLYVATIHNLAYALYQINDLETAMKYLIEVLSYCIDEIDTSATLNFIGVIQMHTNSNNTNDNNNNNNESSSLLIDALENLYKSLEIQTDMIMIGTIMNNIGRIYFIQEQYDHACSIYMKAALIRKEHLNLNHIDFAASLFNIGRTMHLLSKIDDAILYYHEYLKIIMSQFGLASIYNYDIAYTMKCIAQIHHQKGNMNDAKYWYEYSLSTFQKSLTLPNNKYHPEIASIYNKLGNIYYDENNYDIAMQMYENGLLVERAIFIYNHPNISVTLSNIAQIHKIRCNYNAALTLYQEVYNLQTSTTSTTVVDGSNSNTTDNDNDNNNNNNNVVVVAVTLSNMALIHYQTLNYTTSLDLYQEALRIRREQLGEIHLDVASTLNSIGLVLFKLRLLPMALDSFTRSLHIRRHIYGDNHKDVAVNLYNIATIQLELGNEDDAMEYYKATLHVEEIVRGYNHIDIAQTLSYIAQVQRCNGNVHDALNNYKRILHIQKLHLHVNDIKIATTYKCIANIYFILGNAKECINTLTNVARIVLHNNNNNNNGNGDANNSNNNNIISFCDCNWGTNNTTQYLYFISKCHPEVAPVA